MVRVGVKRKRPARVSIKCRNSCIDVGPSLTPLKGCMRNPSLSSSLLTKFHTSTAWD